MQTKFDQKKLEVARTEIDWFRVDFGQIFKKIGKSVKFYKKLSKIVGI